MTFHNFTVLFYYTFGLALHSTTCERTQSVVVFLFFFVLFSERALSRAQEYGKVCGGGGGALLFSSFLGFPSGRFGRTSKD